MVRGGQYIHIEVVGTHVAIEIDQVPKNRGREGPHGRLRRKHNSAVKTTALK